MNFVFSKEFKKIHSLFTGMELNFKKRQKLNKSGIKKTRVWREGRV